MTKHQALMDSLYDSAGRLKNAEDIVRVLGPVFLDYLAQQKPVEFLSLFKLFIAFPEEDLRRRIDTARKICAVNNDFEEDISKDHPSRQLFETVFDTLFSWLKEPHAHRILSYLLVEQGGLLEYAVPVPLFRRLAKLDFFLNSATLQVIIRYQLVGHLQTAKILPSTLRAVIDGETIMHQAVRQPLLIVQTLLDKDTKVRDSLLYTANRERYQPIHLALSVVVRLFLFYQMDPKRIVNPSELGKSDLIKDILKARDLEAFNKARALFGDAPLLKLCQVIPEVGACVSLDAVEQILKSSDPSQLSPSPSQLSVVSGSQHSSKSVSLTPPREEGATLDLFVGGDLQTIDLAAAMFDAVGRRALSGLTVLFQEERRRLEAHHPNLFSILPRTPGTPKNFNDHVKEPELEPFKDFPQPLDLVRWLPSIYARGNHKTLIEKMLEWPEGLGSWCSLQRQHPSLTAEYVSLKSVYAKVPGDLKIKMTLMMAASLRQYLINQFSQLQGALLKPGDLLKKDQPDFREWVFEKKQALFFNLSGLVCCLLNNPGGLLTKLNEVIVCQNQIATHLKRILDEYKSVVSQFRACFSRELLTFESLYPIFLEHGFSGNDAIYLSSFILQEPCVVLASEPSPSREARLRPAPRVLSKLFDSQDGAGSSPVSSRRSSLASSSGGGVPVGGLVQST